MLYRVNADNVVNLNYLIRIQRIAANNFTVFFVGQSFANITGNQIEDILTRIGYPENF